MIVAGMAFGDIGVAAAIGGGAALLSGITCLFLRKQIRLLERQPLSKE